MFVDDFFFCNFMPSYFPCSEKTQESSKMVKSFCAQRKCQTKTSITLPTKKSFPYLVLFHVKSSLSNPLLFTFLHSRNSILSQIFGCQWVEKHNLQKVHFSL